MQYQFATFKNDGYNKTGKGYLKLQLINQRGDFSFALFSGGLSKVSTPSPTPTQKKRILG